MSNRASYEGEAELFEQVESMVRPIIMSNAGRFMRQLDMSKDEAVQEARIALMLALRNYSYNDSRGGIYKFAATSVRRHFLKKLKALQAQRRMAHVVVVEDGKRKAVRMLPEPAMTGTEFVESCAGGSVSPDKRLWMSDEVCRAEEFRGRLTGSLAPRERSVLKCKTDPPIGLQMLMIEDGEEEPTIPMIATHLGLTKNQTDWALKRIREEAIRLIQRGDFSDLAEHLVVRIQMGAADA